MATPLVGGDARGAELPYATTDTDGDAAADMAVTGGARGCRAALSLVVLAAVASCGALQVAQSGHEGKLRQLSGMAHDGRWGNRGPADLKNMYVDPQSTSPPPD